MRHASRLLSFHRSRDMVGSCASELNEYAGCAMFGTGNEHLLLIYIFRSLECKITSYFVFVLLAPDAAAACHLYLSENGCVKILLVEHLKTAGRRAGESRFTASFFKRLNHLSGELGEGRLNCKCCS